MTATTDRSLSPVDVDVLIGPHLDAAVAALDGPAPLLAGMARYHLGLVDASFSPVAPMSVDRGKRVRPMVALLCAAAAGGDLGAAAPLGAALELLHNFTLVHDDIQDESPTRRHRPTVWRLWGGAQAINAGDGLFAAAHIALHRLRLSSVSAELVLRLADEFERMTLEIVAGQVQDLSFETRTDVSPDDYLAMIAGKTAAIVRYATWAGALLGGAGEREAERFGEFGLALGLGFQVQDDLLGVWGAPAQTGKAAADDIRRKKQSLPVLLLRAALPPDGVAELDTLYAATEIDPVSVGRVLTLLDECGIRARVEDQVRRFHRQAIEALDSACPDRGNGARQTLLALVESLATRSK